MLIEQGVRRGDRVGIYLNKNLESAVAIYGIMKTGAGYVPLDPLAPVSRISFIMRDCNIRHLIVDNSKRRQLLQLAATETLCESIIGLSTPVDLQTRTVSWDDVAVMPNRTPVVKMIEHDLAYVMYTSGSTGKPKGLMHTHHSGLSYARMSASLYNLHHQDRLSNHSPLHFDMSTFDYFSGPLAGAATVIIPEEYTKLPASLSKLMEAERLTIWYSVPFALTQLLLRGVLDSRDLTSLRWVLFGGEPFPPKYLRALIKQWPHARFGNVYGPAEVNQCTYFHVPPIPDDSDEPVSIGQMCDNAEGLVVDANDQPLAEGELGELLVRTATMMRGYWGRPDLNQQAFYRQAVYPDFEAVYYRTGDLVQLQPDGNFKFLGRKDRQVKIRGHRVELDEVEAALLSNNKVEECAAFSVPDADGSQKIEAAVILVPDATTSATELIKPLKELLPWYAVPGTISITPTFPRTSSGKIDRNKLREQAMSA
jgi:amino acid adenylation domain-containing protein